MKCEEKKQVKEVVCGVCVSFFRLLLARSGVLWDSLFGLSNWDNSGASTTSRFLL